MSSQIIVLSTDLTVAVVFRPVKYLFGDCLGRPRPANDQQKILTEIIVCGSGLTVSGVFSTRWARFWGLFRCTSKRWCPGDYSSSIIACSSVLTVPGVFRSNEFVFGDLIGVPRHVDAQEKMLSQIMVCSSVLTEVIPGFFFDPLCTFLRTDLLYLATLMPRSLFRPKS